MCMLIYTTCIYVLGDRGTEVERQRSRVRVPWWADSAFGIFPHKRREYDLHAYIYYMYTFWRPWHRGRASTVPGSSPVMSGFCLWDFSTQPARVRICLLIFTTCIRFGDNGIEVKRQRSRVRVPWWAGSAFWIFHTTGASTNVHAYIYYMYTFGRPWHRGRASTVPWWAGSAFGIFTHKRREYWVRNYKILICAQNLCSSICLARSKFVLQIDQSKALFGAWSSFLSMEHVLKVL